MRSRRVTTVKRSACRGRRRDPAVRLKACEAALVGARLDDAVLRAASALAVEGARPLGGNGFKVELLQRTVHRLLADVLVTPPTSP